MATWTDYVVLFCLALTILSVAAVSAAAHSSSVVRGTVFAKGEAFIQGKEGRTATKTLTVKIENYDRVFRIDGGTVVVYAVSDDDAQAVDVGMTVDLLVLSYDNRAKLIGTAGGPRL